MHIELYKREIIKQAVVSDLRKFHQTVVWVFAVELLLLVMTDVLLKCKYNSFDVFL